MSNWLKIGVPIVIAVLLIVATVGITIAITGRSVAGQAADPGYAAGQVTGTQFSRGLQCSSCAGKVQANVANDPDGPTVNANGATCPSCPGYNAGTAVPPAVTTRSGCCGSR